MRLTRRQFISSSAGLAAAGVLGHAAPAIGQSIQPGTSPSGWVPSYPDGRPVATLRMDAVDQGVVLTHGDAWDRLAVFYDGAAGTSMSHMGRDVGLAWLDLPLRAPRRGGGLRNLARNAVASASTTYPGYAATRVNDGSPNTGLGERHSWSNAYLAPAPHWVTLDFPRPTTFGRVDLYTTSGYELSDYQLQIWNGSRWVNCGAPVSGNTSVLRTHQFFPVTTTALRVLCLRGPSRQPEFVRVNEIEIYSAISAGPEPTDRSTE